MAIAGTSPAMDGRRRAYMDVLVAFPGMAIPDSGPDSVLSTAVGRTYMRNTPNRVSSIGAFIVADRHSPSTIRVSAGSITPSSHRRAEA